ncbi:hypothetical protein KUCAC02_002094 [Chaenocephalus aceratus]|uniref:Uncharacterized protein n=1 Tax=Chaenocephalus aceratus TaxID=36190 RepID=A0ACB9XU78_CHAAC|nr:hypothetical protein KUCAC02_002094 [Chaenocephalus aceratus]
MYTWYVVMEAPFDFTIHDMPCLRRWWCTLLVENLQVERHGRRFAHFTVEGQQMRRQIDSGSVTPLTRISRKRQCDEVTMEPVPSKHSKMKEPEGMAVGILQASGYTVIFLCEAYLSISLQSHKQLEVSSM